MDEKLNEQAPIRRLERGAGTGFGPVPAYQEDLQPAQPGGPIQTANLVLELAILPNNQPIQAEGPRTFVTARHTLAFNTRGGGAILQAVNEAAASVANLLGLDLRITWTPKGVKAGVNAGVIDREDAPDEAPHNEHARPVPRVPSNEEIL